MGHRLDAAVAGDGQQALVCHSGMVDLNVGELGDGGRLEQTGIIQPGAVEGQKVQLAALQGRQAAAVDGGVAVQQQIAQLGHIAIYKCYNRSQHKGQCDGPSTYRAEKVDKVIEQLLRGIFERAKKVDEKTILKMLVDASAEQCQQELKAAKLEYTKTMKELSRWGDLMLDSLDGTCVFTPEQVKARLDAVQAKADEIAHQVQQLEEKSRQMKPAAADLLREHQQILTWAELFDSAAIEEKKVIASYLIKAVTLTRGYGIQVDFNISEAQFLNGLEMG